MSQIDTRPQNDSASTEPITDLRALDVGDQVLFGGRQRALDVVAVGTRTVTDERIDKEIETPVVRVQGGWDGAVDRVLAHKLDRYDGGIQLEELSKIVACEGADLERGEVVTVRRVAHSAEVSA